MLKKVKILLFSMIGCFAINPALADINPWAWKVNYSTAHGIWKTVCDEQVVEGEQLDRCYVRWVDVFSEKPKFGALFVFITAEKSGLAIDFSLEPGAIFVKDGFKIVENQQSTWKIERSSCLTQRDCKLRPDEINEFFAAAESGEHLKFSLIDRYEQRHDLTWPLAGFNAAMEDLSQQLKAREAN